MARDYRPTLRNRGALAVRRGSSLANEEAAKPKAELLYSKGRRSIGVCSNIVFTIEDIEPDFDYLDELSRTIDQAHRTHEGSIGLLIVISDAVKPPSDDVRARIQQDRIEMAHAIRAAAHVVGGAGFLAAAKRSVLALLFAATRPPFPSKVFGEIDDALSWLFSMMGERAPSGIAPEQLAREIRSISRGILDVKR